MSIFAIPVFGWMLGAVLAVGLAVPFWFCWTVKGIGVKYAEFLPVVYQAPAFWDTVFLFVCVSIIKSVFVPTFVSSTSSSESK